MNLDKLHAAQASFLMRYPQGFDDPALEPIKKKHNVGKLIELTQAALTKENCRKSDFVASTLLSIVSRCSMISRFEKPQFKHFINALDSDERDALAFAVRERLHGNKRAGFEQICGMLAHHKIAKWAVISAVPFYFAPRREVFVKPTTAKNIIEYLEVPDLHYEAMPRWVFYTGYRKLITAVKREVPKSLAPNNAALTGFLMLST